MADTKNTKTEVGIIGQTYQNRKTKKIGTLESRNEKCKTLCMVDPDGKTFNIVYSTFKSDWRKHGDDATTTKSTETKKPEVKDAPAKNTKTEENKSETKARGRKSTVSAEEKVKTLMSTKSILESAVSKSKLPVSVKQLSKGGLVVKHNRHTVFEIWPKFNGKYEFVVGEIKLSKCEFVKREESWKNKNVYRTDNLKSTIESVLEQIASDIKVAEEKKNKTTKKEEK